MAKRLSIVAEPREVIGKQVKQLRRAGMIPAIIYGQVAAEAVKLDNLKLRRVLRVAGRTHLIDLEMSGATKTVLARDIQVHPTRGDLIHVDFYEVDMKQKVIVDATIVMKGKISAELKGVGMPSQTMPHIQIECFPDALISELSIDLALFKTVNDMIAVKDMIIPEGVEIVNVDPETIVATFLIDRRAVAGEDGEPEAEVAAPVVIGAKPVVAAAAPAKK